MLLEPGGNDGALLAEKIDDKSAYLWKRYAHGFSTFFGHQEHSHYNRAHRGNMSPYSNGNYDWDWIGAKSYTADRDAAKPYHPDYQVKKDDKIDVINGFTNLVGIMIDLEEYPVPEGAKYIDRCFLFKNAHSNHILVPFPLYYYSDYKNRYNGYGSYRCYYYSDYINKSPGDKPTSDFDGHDTGHAFQTCTFAPGEPIVLVINANLPKQGWCALPKYHFDAHYKLYDHNCVDPFWGEYEKLDYLVDNVQPDKY